MASVEKYYRNVGDTRWRARWRDADGKSRKRGGFEKKGAAEDFLATVRADTLRGTYVDHRAGRVTFKAYATDWLASQTTEESTREALALRLRVHVYPVFGGKQLAQIKASTIRSWLAGLTLAPSYQRAVYATVSAILSAAIDDERIAKNPCKAASVIAPRREPRKVEPWSVDRVLAVRDALPAPYRIAATLAAGLGLRQGEVFGFSPDDVDFLRGVVRVERSVKVLNASGRQLFALPKGGKTRTVPLPPSVRDDLAAHLAAHTARSVSLPWREFDADAITVPLVLSTRQGTALNRNYWNRFIWKPALKSAGVEEIRENGMHALRHFYASALLDGGENIKAVSEYLGHSDAAFTLRTYAHVMPSSVERTRKAVDAVLGEKSRARSVPSAVPDSGSHA